MAKVKISREGLNKALVSLNQGLPSKAILGFDGAYAFNIRAKDEQCYITIANARVQITAYVHCETDEDVNFCVPNHIMKNTVHNFPDGNINIVTEHAVDNSKHEYVNKIKLTPEGKRKKYAVVCINDRGFPFWKKINQDEVVRFTIKMPKFNEIMKLIGSNVDLGDPTECFRNIPLVSENGKMLFVSGNSHMISFVKTDIPFESKVIIPAEISRYVSQLTENGDCEVIITKNRISISYSGIKILSRMVEGRIADYLFHLNNEPQDEVVIPRIELLETLRRLAAFTENEGTKSNVLALSCEKDSLGVYSRSSFGDEGDEELDVTNKKDCKFALGLNHSYLSKALSHIKSDDIHVRALGSRDQFYIRPADKSELDQIWILAPCVI